MSGGGVMISHLSVQDRGLHYGDGLFETIAVVDGVPCLWERHIERLQTGCRRLGITTPDDLQLFQEAQTLVGDKKERYVLKIIVTRGEGERGYRPSKNAKPSHIITLSAWPGYPESCWTDGITARICSTPLGCNPALAGLKHLNRLEQVIASSEWDDPAIHEGLMLDCHGRVIEGISSNLFMLTNHGWKTPDLSSCGVAGVVRGVLIEQMRNRAIPLQIGEIWPDEIKNARAVIMTNSLIGVWPVRSIEDVEYDVHAIDSEFLAEVRRLVVQP